MSPASLPALTAQDRRRAQRNGAGGDAPPAPNASRLRPVNAGGCIGMPMVKMAQYLAAQGNRAMAASEHLFFLV